MAGFPSIWKEKKKGRELEGQEGKLNGRRERRQMFWNEVWEKREDAASPLLLTALRGGCTGRRGATAGGLCSPGGWELVASSPGTPRRVAVSIARPPALHLCAERAGLPRTGTGTSRRESRGSVLQIWRKEKRAPLSLPSHLCNSHPDAERGDYRPLPL